jgi:hypothetical protein
LPLEHRLDFYLDANLPGNQQPTAGLTVTRLANHDGQVSFAGTTDRADRMWAQAFTDVTITAGSVQLSEDGKVPMNPGAGR